MRGKCFYSFQAVTEGGDRLKRIYGALPHTPLKELFEKSSLRSLNHLSVFSF